ncbi:MAG: tRNA (N6-isopentenyl adenosine(37)-C2)-methylthiotransferase MiaB [Chloroflexi bacterium]|nr:tRNA (N6-isopentenyl adenosine(37)-C2)-methylthiotransferase MiaB [Chloroflexota bacterium]
MPLYYVWNIGCQMNAADARRAEEGLEALGLRRAAQIEQADVIVLNTCVVRQSAEDRVWGRLRSLKPIKAKNPRAFLALMGCAVGDPDALARQFPYVDAFIRPSDVDGLLRAVEQSGLVPAPQSAAPRDSDQGSGEESAVVPVSAPCPSERSEAPRTARAEPSPISRGITAIYGCNHRCTYCIVRLRRGEETSRPVADIVREAEQAAERGAREIVLLGQNVDAYGRDLVPPLDLADLLRAVHDVEGIWRIRFLTSHPGDLSSHVIQAVRDLPKVCEHFELPVQSGDDGVLRRMGRTYTAQQYRDLVRAIRDAVPGAAIATDVIVGFPGETDEAFQNTYRLLEEIRFDAVHVAAYSVRPGTPAERLPDDVPPDEKERRRKAVDDLQKRIVGEINQALVGRAVEVLVEGQKKGRWFGRTRTNKLVFFDSPLDWRGRLAWVRITWAGPWSLVGEVSPTAVK